MIQKDPKKSYEIMGADVKQSGEQFGASAKYLRWQDKAANQKFFDGELQQFSKEAADLLLEIGIIKAMPDINTLVRHAVHQVARLERRTASRGAMRRRATARRAVMRR